MKRLLLAASLMAALGLSRPARAASCTVNEVSAVTFGAYNPFSGVSGSGQGFIAYQCSLFNALDRVTIDLSAGSSNQYLPWRTLLSGSRPLSYNLYLDPALTRVWGDGSGSTFHYGPVVLAILETRVYVYGYIPPSQNAWEGSYSDTITITLNF